MFDRTGWSYPWGDLEDQMVGNSRPTHRPPQEAHFPRETASIWRRIEDRRKLIGQLMSRSSTWERDLSHQLGGVSFLEVQGSPEMAAAMGADKDGRVMLGRPADPWRELEGKAFPFVEPIFLDALFDPDVNPEDVHPTRDYQDFRPWLFNDLDESKVAQWHHDLTGMPLWPRSWTSYQIAAGEYSEDEVPVYGEVKRRVQQARETRCRVLGVTLVFGPSQLHFW